MAAATAAYHSSLPTGWPGDASDRVPDVVVVPDRVEGLVFRGPGPPGLHTHPQQRRVEDLLLRRGVQLEERGQPVPDGAQGLGVGRVDLLQDREQAALLVMVVEDQLSDVHRMLSLLRESFSQPRTRAPARPGPAAWSGAGRAVPVPSVATSRQSQACRPSQSP